MSKKFRLLALFMAIAISAAAFAGCGGKESASSTGSNDTASAGEDVSGTEDPTQSGEESTASDSTESGGSTTSTGTGTTSTGGSTTTGERKLEGNVYTSGFPIVKDTVELRVLVEKTSLHTKAFDQMAFSKDYEKKTGVKIKWETYGTAERLTKKTSAMASGNYPDIMCMIDAFRSSEVVKYGEAGALLDITNDIAKWAPNVQKAINSSSTVKKAITAPNGKIYSVPSVNSVEDHMVYPEKMFINKKWLDILGLKAPTTYAEFIEVMRAFKKGDPNGNGQADEIPFAVDNFNPMIAGAPQGIEWRWDTDRMYVDESGKVGYFMASDAYRSSIKFLKTLYSENLLDRNVFLGTKQVTTVAQTGKVGCFIELAGSTSLNENVMNDYVLLAPLKADANSKPTVMTNRRGQVVPFSMVITASASKNQKKEIALRWIDYFFTPDGYIYEQYGPSTGGYYKTNADKTLEVVSVKKNGVTTKKSDAERYQVAPGYVMPSWYTQEAKNKWKVLSDSQMSKGEIFFRDIDEKSAINTYSKYVHKNYIGNLFFSKADDAKLTSYETNLHSYAYNTGIAFVKGDQNVDTEWNTYLNELKKKDVDGLVALYQKAYDAQK